MPRKKRRKSKKGFFSGLGQGIAVAGSFLLRVIPLVIVISLSAGLFIGVRSVLYADSNLLVQKISIQPHDALSPSIRQSLESRYVGKNVLKVDLDAIAAQLQKDPTIKKADVRRSFPDEITVDVRQRTPLGWVRFARGGYYGLISDDGVIVDTAKQKNRQMIDIEAYSIKGKIKRGYYIREQSFHEGVKFLKKFWAHEIAKQETIATMKIDRNGNVTVSLGGGPDLRMGRYPSERMSFIPKVIPILQSAERGNIDYIDLQYDDVIVKRKGT